jgi:methylthioribose-1-phosphate isomerase
MRVGDTHYRTIWLKDSDPEVVRIINQQKLPHIFETMDLKSVHDAATAIRDMYIRGAGLIGATAGYGMYLAALQARRDSLDNDGFSSALEDAGRQLTATRPTAANLAWAVNRQLESARGVDSPEEKLAVIKKNAQVIADEDAEFCRRIGEHGLQLIKEIASQKKNGPVNILTHCNAGWLAFVDYGSATAPIYAAFDAGLDVHVWVDETRPRNQGASLTVWELGQHGVSHHLVPDNTGGHLMQHGMVDIVITGADRVTAAGDAANKIGTYLKALAARDNDVPFFVALPSSTFDFSILDGVKDIPIETRDQDEVRYMSGLLDGTVERVLICPPETEAINYGFDVTPARLVTGLITERGICRADRGDIAALFPELENHFSY